MVGSGRSEPGLEIKIAAIPEGQVEIWVEGSSRNDGVQLGNGFLGLRQFHDFIQGFPVGIRRQVGREIFFVFGESIGGLVQSFKNFTT